MNDMEQAVKQRVSRALEDYFRSGRQSERGRKGRRDRFPVAGNARDLLSGPGRISPQGSGESRDKR